MVPKDLKRKLLFTSANMSALVNPSGVAEYIGPESTCVRSYMELRFHKGVDYTERQARELIAVSGWQVIKVRSAIYTADVTAAEVEAIAPRASADAVL